MGRPRGWASERTGRPLMRSPGRPPGWRREHRQRSGQRSHAARRARPLAWRPVSRRRLASDGSEPHRLLPRPERRAAEPQHARADGDHQRLDRIAERAAGRRDRARLGIQRVTRG
jgi:hypothetical protein